MPSMYGKSFAEKSKIWNGERAERDLGYAQRRIAELEHQANRLEAERVPDELLEWLFQQATYAGAWGDKYDQAEAILAKRKGNR